MKDRFLKHKRIEGEFGKWNDASKTLPNKDGSYLVILETRSPNIDCQTWGGVGKPEVNSFHEEWHFKWSGHYIMDDQFRTRVTPSGVRDKLTARNPIIIKPNNNNHNHPLIPPSPCQLYLATLS